MHSKTKTKTAQVPVSSTLLQRSRPTRSPPRPYPSADASPQSFPNSSCARVAAVSGAVLTHAPPPYPPPPPPRPLPPRPLTHQRTAGGKVDMPPLSMSPLSRGLARLAGPRLPLRRISGPQAASDGALVAFLTLKFPPWKMIIRCPQRHLLLLLFSPLREVQCSPAHRRLQFIPNRD